MPQVIQVEANLAWKCVRTSGGNYVAVCDPLRLTVQSDTWASLMEDISDTLDMVLKDLLASDQLPKFLKDQGWTLVRPLPSRAEQKNVRFDVPFSAAMNRRAHDTQANLH